MDLMLESSIERLKDLEAELEDMHILLDLEREAHNDTKVLLKIAKAQIERLMVDRTIEVIEAA